MTDETFSELETIVHDLRKRADALEKVLLDEKTDPKMATFWFFKLLGSLQLLEELIHDVRVVMEGIERER